MFLLLLRAISISHVCKASGFTSRPRATNTHTSAVVALNIKCDLAIPCRLTPPVPSPPPLSLQYPAPFLIWLWGPIICHQHGPTRGECTAFATCPHPFSLPSLPIRGLTLTHTLHMQQWVVSAFYRLQMFHVWGFVESSCSTCSGVILQHCLSDS